METTTRHRRPRRRGRLIALSLATAAAGLAIPVLGVSSASATEGCHRYRSLLDHGSSIEAIDFTWCDDERTDITTGVWQLNDFGQWVEVAEGEGSATYTCAGPGWHQYRQGGWPPGGTIWADCS
jgi:hypothetical protein